jgi:YYY domain-containing protein
VIGSLRAINTWDFPTYLIIGALAVLFWAWQMENGRFTQRAILRFVAGTAVLWSIAFLSFYPFAANYVTGYSSLSAWQGSYTHASRYLIVWGLFLFLIIPHLAREFRDWSNSLTPKYLRQSEAIGWLAMAGLIVLVVLIFWMWTQQYWVAPIVLPLIVLAGLMSLRRTLPTPRRIVLVLIASALFLTLFVEVAVLDGDIGRMNTVFKFYLQAWLMLSVVGGLTAVWIYPAIRQRKKMHTIWSIALGVLLFAAVLYPVLATGAKWRIRMNPDAPHTLDGMAFMPYVEYGERGGQTLSLASDYEAINWMQRNIDGSPVIMEAHSDNPYRSIGNRVAMYTGLPSVIGWDWHQRQQRAAAPDSGVQARITDVNAFYNAPDINFATFLIAKYGVEYIYVGALEWAYYDPTGLTKFDQMVTDGLLEEVYRNPETSIYHVIDTE